MSVSTIKRTFRTLRFNISLKTEKMRMEDTDLAVINKTKKQEEGTHKSALLVKSTATTIFVLLQ